MEISSSINLMGTVSQGIDFDALDRQQPRKLVLIVDDELENVQLLKTILMKSGFNVIGAYTGSECLDKCAHYQPDLVILDLMMPDMDGWQVYSRLRKLGDIPVIILSAVSEKTMVVRGLESGADDYLTKPFFPAELVARVQKILERKGNNQKPKGYHFREIDLAIQVDRKEVQFRGKTLYLQSKVFDLLSILAAGAPHVVSNQEIACQIWGEEDEKAQNRIKHLVFLLRQELEENPSEPKLVVNRGRYGYQLVTDPRNVVE